MIPFIIFELLDENVFECHVFKLRSYTISRLHCNISECFSYNSIDGMRIPVETKNTMSIHFLLNLCLVTTNA